MLFWSTEVVIRGVPRRGFTTFGPNSGRFTKTDRVSYSVARRKNKSLALQIFRATVHRCCPFKIKTYLLTLGGVLELGLEPTQEVKPQHDQCRTTLYQTDFPDPDTNSGGGSERSKSSPQSYQDGAHPDSILDRTRGPENPEESFKETSTHGIWWCLNGACGYNQGEISSSPQALSSNAALMDSSWNFQMVTLTAALRIRCHLPVPAC
ncbi:uncharacterized protein LOC133493838 isoform X1 [Syngnathoides biaculeatus]|uniref:uncharacterized protein LOC133493838 isoform X1 n=1 Tax=Syngnathoides biaculeatus TaxID=300417 RepID=UPI002ADE1F11|nr:uncharacterized protein LOC133493838 isoform X1 [Syngnathoides biaculeatus]